MTNALASNSHGTDRAASSPATAASTSVSVPGSTSTTPATAPRRRMRWWPALAAFVSAGAAAGLAGYWLWGSRLLTSVQGGWLEWGLTYGGWVTTAVLVALVAVRAVVALSALSLFGPVGRFRLHRPARIVAVLSGFGLTAYGLGMVVYGVLTLTGLVGHGPVDTGQVLWSTGVWHLWEAVTGVLFLMAAHRSRGARA